MFRTTSPRTAAALLLACVGLSAAFAARPPTPTNFNVEAIDGRNKARLTWTSGADQINFHIQKKLPNGTWTTVSGFPVNHLNTGSFVYDTPQTQEGTFKFWIAAKQGSIYSEAHERDHTQRHALRGPACGGPRGDRKTGASRVLIPQRERREVRLADVQFLGHEMDLLAPRGQAPLRLQMMRAGIEKKLGFPKEALKTCEVVLRLKPDLPLALVTAAGCHGDLGQSTEEYRFATIAFALQPHLSMAMINMAEALIHTDGQQQQALNLLDRAVGLQEELPLGHLLRAIALISIGRNQGALAAFETSIRQWPEDADVWANLAKLHGQMGEWARALEACDEVLRLDPTLANTHSDRGTALLMLDRHEEALVAARHAIELQPDNQYALNVEQLALQGLH